MRLRVQVPTERLLEEDVGKVVAEGVEGSIGILPRHIDYVAVLVPGILTFEEPDGGERLLAVDRGVLVKRGDLVTVSVRDAVRGEDLATLRQTVRERFEKIDQRERGARSALAQLEARFIRHFLQQAEGLRERG